MCRLLTFIGEPSQLGALAITPSHSLFRQSWLARELVEAKVNADGWGAGLFLSDDPSPCVYVSTQPIWADVNLPHLGRAWTSHSLVAAVRSATDPFTVAPVNTQPFAAEGLLFVHNGYVENFPSLRRRFYGALSDEGLASLRGMTDSEHLFALILDGLGGRLDAEDLLVAGARAIGMVSGWALDAGGVAHFSLVLSTREAMVAFRTSTGPTPPSLYLLEEAASLPRGTLVASEPLDDDPKWRAIPPGSAVVARRGAPAQLVPIP